MSTFSFAAHSLHSFVSASLALGTQWSQNPTLSFPAAQAPGTNGDETAAAAAPCKTVRRVTDRFIDTSLFGISAGKSGLRSRREPARMQGVYRSYAKKHSLFA